MKPTRLLACGMAAVALLSLIAPVAGAYQTPILPGIELQLYGSLGVMDQLYGWANVTRLDDGPLPGDQIFPWLTGGDAYAQARYAGANNTFGYFVGSAGGPFNSLFTVAGGQGFSVRCADGCDPRFAHDSLRTQLHDRLHLVVLGVREWRRDGSHGDLRDHRRPGRRRFRSLLRGQAVFDLRQRLQRPGRSDSRGEPGPRARHDDAPGHGPCLRGSPW